MFSKVTLFISCCLIFSGCFLKKEHKVDVSFSADSNAILICNIEETNLYHLKSALKLDSSTANIASVTVVDSDGNLQNVNGIFSVSNSCLRFAPTSPFVKGNKILVKTILNSSFGKTKDIIKSNLGTAPKQTTKILQR